MNKIIYHGHSFVELNLDDKKIFIDPFISGNPMCDITADDAKCDYILLTHGHGDHYGDTDELAKSNNATVISVFEITEYLTAKGVKAHGLGIGGSCSFPFGKVKLTIAHHSSSFSDGTYAGEPSGILIENNGVVIYHAGDTGLFLDMKLIGEMHRIDHALLPIGDNYTMGVGDAVKAAEFLNARNVIPIHYNTFDVIKADAEEFKRKIESIGRKCTVMLPGNSLDI